MRIRAVSAPWYDGIEILICDGPKGNLVAVKSLTFETVPVGSLVQPTGHMERDEAQQLMDELWNCGIRPTEGAGSAGAMRAVERHLDDMRTLVFNKAK